MSLAFNDDEKNVMNRLDTYILWKGRYSNAKDFIAGKSECQMHIEFFDGSNEIIDTIYQKALVELDRLDKLHRARRKLQIER
jgi:hypothetical protein